jgi:hypothetical protein
MNSLQTVNKKCTVCSIEKNLNNYAKDNYRKDGYDATCKECKKKQRNERRKNSKIPSIKECSLCKQVLAADNFHKKSESLDGLHSECKECKKQKRLEKKKQNQEKELSINYNKICGTREYFKNYHNRRISNPQYKLSGNIRNRVRMALKRQNTSKFRNTFDLIGCSPLFMTQWLEHQFNSNMSWNNYGIYWQIDHVIPCTFFNLIKREEQLRCFNWRNCRPCTKTENNSKNNKIQPLQILLQEIRVHYYERHIQIAGKS